MKRTFALLASCLFAFALALTVSTPALACEPRIEADPNCAMPRPKPRVVARVAPTSVPTPTNAPAVAFDLNSASSPQSALGLDKVWPKLGANPTGQPQSKWQTINPNSAQWFRLDNGEIFFYTVLWLDSTNKDALMKRSLELMAYSPEQANDMSLSAKPIGRAWPTKEGSEHDFFYRGTHTYGVWYFVLRNDNPLPLEFKLTFWRAPDDRECGRVYDEINAFKVWITWQDCGLYGTNKTLGK